jgi:hypothetical protein
MGDPCGVFVEWDARCSITALPGTCRCREHAETELLATRDHIERVESLHKDLTRYKVRYEALKKALGR